MVFKLTNFSRQIFRNSPHERLKVQNSPQLNGEFPLLLQNLKEFCSRGCSRGKINIAMKKPISQIQISETQHI